MNVGIVVIEGVCDVISAIIRMLVWLSRGCVSGADGDVDDE